jgi:hypothetical protein
VPSRSLFILLLGAGLAACGPEVRRGEIFAAYQAEMQERGYLRTDVDPQDVQYSNARLAEHFRRIAFFTFPNDEMHISKPLTRWQGPIRYAVLGTEDDQEQVDRLMGRIAGLTGMDIRHAPEQHANFVVLLMNDGEQRAARLSFPDDESRAFFDGFVSAIFDCGAIADWSDDEPEITRALVYLHGDLQGLYRRLCFQEEISQSFGLFNDDPTVRPSIFNDDDEFALLTTHDEYLLRILYDPRLRVGMTEEEAMPIVHHIIREMRPAG